MRESINKIGMGMGLLGYALAVHAAAPVTRTYQVINVQQVAVNDPACAATFQSLKGLMQKPLVFELVPTSQSNKFLLKDQQGQLEQNNYTVLQQRIANGVIERVGAGSFVLQQQKINYVVEIAADVTQADFKYLYPMILSSNNAHCLFTAVLSPDAATQAKFKASVQSGKAVNNADLTE